MKIAAGFWQHAVSSLPSPLLQQPRVNVAIETSFAPDANVSDKTMLPENR